MQHTLSTAPASGQHQGLTRVVVLPLGMVPTARRHTSAWPRPARLPWASALSSRVNGKARLADLA